MQHPKSSQKPSKAKSHAVRVPAKIHTPSDGRDHWQRHEGLFRYADFPDEGVRRSSELLVARTYELLARDEQSFSEDEISLITRQMRTAAGKYTAEKRFFDAPKPKHYRSKLPQIQKQSINILRQLNELPVETRRKLSFELGRSSLEVWNNAEKLRGLAAVEQVLGEFAAHCDIHRSIRGTRGKRPHSHIEAALLIFLETWVLLTCQKVPKNADAPGRGEIFKSPGARFAHELLLTLDPTLSRRFGAVEALLREFPFLS
jgi:hypothetical protein